MSKRVKIIVGVVILGVLALFAINNIFKWHKKVVKKEIRQEEQKWQDQANQLEEKVAELEDELSFSREANGTVPSEKVSRALGQVPDQTRIKQEAQSNFQDVEAQVAAFFSYLDQQEYVAAYKFKGGTHYEFRQAVNAISAKSPVVTGETDNLYRLMTNIAYFYRALGKDRIRLVNDVLNHEAEIIEPVIGTFYKWFTLQTISKPKLQGRPSFNTLYEISGFFLNTLAGQSYLFRRAPKIRTLTRYYCVLILDQANDNKLNRFGIDIRPHIKGVYREIKSTIGLADRTAYLAKLDGLAVKYKI